MQGKSGKNDLFAGGIALNEFFLYGGFAYCRYSSVIFIVDSDYESEMNTSWTDQYQLLANKIVLFGGKSTLLKIHCK